MIAEIKVSQDICMCFDDPSVHNNACIMGTSDVSNDSEKIKEL
ncbi:hypothetical protein [Bartonella tamiae]